MANGDITAVKVLYRQSLGGGQSGTGVAKNTKILVCGEITATWADAGIAVNKTGGDTAFGVSTLDLIKLQVITLGIAGTATGPAAEKLMPASYDAVNKKIFCVIDEGQATPANPAAGQTCVIAFIAVGDDADAPELT